jgi:hypothetical protein
MKMAEQNVVFFQNAENQAKTKLQAFQGNFGYSD